MPLVGISPPINKHLFKLDMPNSKQITVAPPEGKLGVLIPGIGAVSTTFMAGVEAVKRGLGLPIGSLTQLATIRLGKRTDGRSPGVRPKSRTSYRLPVLKILCSGAGTFMKTPPMRPL
jgi:hypothetical protein